ncbi:hypothetical protein Tco_1509342, partial [Tanacetum coccineum]
WISNRSILFDEATIITRETKESTKLRTEVGRGQFATAVTLAGSISTPAPVHSSNQMASRAIHINHDEYEMQFCNDLQVSKGLDDNLNEDLISNRIAPHVVHPVIHPPLALDMNL